MSIISEFLSFFKNERHTQEVTATTTDSIALMWKGQAEGEAGTDNSSWHRRQNWGEAAGLRIHFKLGVHPWKILTTFPSGD